MPGFIASQIARINRNYLLVALALGMVVATMAYFGWSYVSAVVLGPKSVSAEEMFSPQFQSDPNTYKRIVQVEGTPAGQVFYRERVRRGKGYGTLYCWLLKAGNAQVIVEGWQPSASASAVGRFREAPAGIYRAAGAWAKYGAIYPLALDTRDWKADGWMLLIYGSAVAIAAAVILGMLLWWGADPNRHPVRRAVLRVGDFEATAMQIDAEMQAQSQSFGPVHIGQTMLVYAPAFSFDVARLENVSSAQTKWLRKGKSNALYLVLDTHEGRQLKWQISRKYGDELLQAVCASARVEAPAAGPKRIELRIGK